MKDGSSAERTNEAGLATQISVAAIRMVRLTTAKRTHLPRSGRAGDRSVHLGFAYHPVVIEIGSRARKLPAPPAVVWNSLVNPHQPGARP
jgi:hypothetical protein